MTFRCYISLNMLIMRVNMLQHLDKYPITIVDASIYKMIIPIDYSGVIKEGTTVLSADRRFVTRRSDRQPR